MKAISQNVVIFHFNAFDVRKKEREWQTIHVNYLIYLGSIIFLYSYVFYFLYKRYPFINDLFYLALQERTEKSDVKCIQLLDMHDVGGERSRFQSVNTLWTRVFDRWWLRLILFFWTFEPTFRLPFLLYDRSNRCTSRSSRARRHRWVLLLPLYYHYYERILVLVPLLLLLLLHLLPHSNTNAVFAKNVCRKDMTR